MMDPDSLRRELVNHILVGVDDKGGRELGRGSYGVVKVVKYEGKEFACKSFHRILMSSAADESKVKKAFIEECRNAVSINHSNIVHTHGLHFPQNSSFPSIIMELLPYCLADVLDNPSFCLCLKSSNCNC